MPEPNVKETLVNYIVLRDALAAKAQEVKDYNARIVAAMSEMELFFKAEMERQGLDKFSAGGMTAFKTTKDSVKIEDKVVFRETIAGLIVDYVVAHDLLSQPGAPGPSELAQFIAESDAFDLLTLGANKTNCKTFMADNKGLMPAGVGYTKIDVIQVRRS